MNAAGPFAPGGPSGPLDVWRTVGCHIGYQLVVTENLNANCAYGYAFADTESNGMVVEVGRRSQNGWLNFFYLINDTSLIGLECQYTKLDVTDGRTGDNLRIQATLRIAK